jgi:hypothetical protein
MECKWMAAQIQEAQEHELGVLWKRWEAALDVLNTGRKMAVGELQDEEDDTVFRALVADCNSRQAIIRKTLSKMPAKPRRSMERELER